MSLGPLIAFGALGLLAMEKNGAKLGPLHLEFDCPVCKGLDPYRDEPECTRCEKHHEWMRKSQVHSNSLERCHRSHVRLIDSNTDELKRLHDLVLRTRYTYSLGGAFVMSAVWIFWAVVCG